MQISIADVQIELVLGDIAREDVVAIVNAANSRLAGGGGVDGAIHRAAGASVMAETRQRYPDGCPTGDAVISSAGDLGAQHIIHAVGPVWRDGRQGEAGLLASAYRRSLSLATEHGCQSVALPALSTGAYGYPLHDASRIALAVALDHARQNGCPQTIRFVLFSEEALAVFERTLTDLLEGDEGVAGLESS